VIKLDEMYKAKMKELERDNIDLRSKIKFLEDKLYDKLGAYQFNFKNVDEIVTKFLLSCKDQIRIITGGFDSEFANYFERLAREGKKVQVITPERHQILDENLIQAFNKIQSNTNIQLFTKGELQGNLLIKDVQQILICNTHFSKENLQSVLSFCISINSKEIYEQFYKYFNNRLPPFMRT